MFQKVLAVCPSTVSLERLAGAVMVLSTIFDVLALFIYLYIVLYIIIIYIYILFYIKVGSSVYSAF